MEIQSIASSVCQKELHRCFMVAASMALLQISEPLRHGISMSLCTDPSGKLPALALHAISVRCSSVREHGWLEQQRGQAGAAMLTSHPGSWAAPLLLCPPHPPPAGSAGPPTQRSSKTLRFPHMGTYPALMKHWDTDLNRCIFSQFKAKNKQRLHPCTLTLRVWPVSFFPLPTWQ